MKRLALITLLLLLALPILLAGGKAVEVSGEWTYYDDGRHSLMECKEAAATQARIEALAREFGTIVSQSLQQTDRIKSGRESNDFLSLAQTEVKGEWIADTSEPVYTTQIDDAGHYIVTCKVRGKARGISNETVAFEAMTLRNGTRRANADNSFREGDELYLLFNPSADGYISVYLEDENRRVVELLPYPKDCSPNLRVKRGQDHVFFSAAEGKGKYGPEEELVMTADSEVEYNRIYVVFSPNIYSRPVTRRSAELGSTSSAEFSKWLLKSRNNDPKMGVKTLQLQILKK